MFRRKRRLQDMSERQFKREIKRVLREAEFATWALQLDELWNQDPDHIKPDKEN